MMTIKEYINKNLPNLNWNILPQIFEENEVELTEEIKTYLKNTPWNTNWNIIKFIDGEESSELTTKKTNLYLTSELSGKNLNLDTTKSDFATFEEAYDYYDSSLGFVIVPYHIQDILMGAGIQPCRWFIQNQDPGLHGDNPGNRNPSLLPAG